MQLGSKVADHTPWERAHFIGGHPALDLANAVFDRLAPLPDNELLHSARDVGGWLHAAGLAGERQAAAVAAIRDPRLVQQVREIRAASFAIFGAIAAGNAPEAEAFGVLCSRAAAIRLVEPLAWQGARPALTLAQWQDPDAVAAFLAVLAIEAFFTVPRDRLRSCPRCGWLFVDTSRGSRRRWCSMRTCGNREKVARHRQHAAL